jgi:multidrug efflux pump
MKGFNLSALAVRETSVTLFLIVAITIAGLFSFFQLGRAEDPTFRVKAMTVSFAWPGATASDMQNQIADPMERRLRELQWIDHVETASRSGTTTLRVTLRDDMPPSAVEDSFYQARKKLTDEAARLPRGALGPFLNDEYGKVYFSLIAFKAPGLSDDQFIEEAERVRRIYLSVKGVAEVDLIGEQSRRIFVEFPRARLTTLGVSPQQVFAALRQENSVVPTGTLNNATMSMPIRVGSGFESLEDVRATPITVGGRSLTIGDIGQVSFGLEDPASYVVRHQGEDAVMFGIVMAKGWNGLDLGQSLVATTAQIKSELPLGMTLEPVVDQARNIAASVNEFMIKFAAALGVVLLVSFLALGWRVGIVVALAVPLTLGAVFVIMLATGRDFDRITLGALILSLGLLVDDAIIAVEMMVVKMEEGMDRISAAAFAWSSTAFPMLTGTLVTIIGFMPVAFAKSTAGEYAGNIFWIVGFALIASWFVAVFFTPYLGVKLLPNIKAEKIGHAASYATPMFNRLRKTVAWAVVRRKLVVGVSLAALVLSGASLAFVQKQFFPNSDRPEVLAELYMPAGSSLAATKATTEKVEAWLLQQPEAVSVNSFVGGGAPRFFLSLNPEAPNPAFAKLLIMTKAPADRDALRRRLQAAFDAGQFPEVRGRATQLVFGPPVPFPVRFRVLGEDRDKVRAIAEQVRDIASKEPTARNMQLEWGDRTPALQLTFDAQRLTQLGLDREAVGQQMQVLLSGFTVTQAREGTRLVDVVVRAPQSERTNPGAIGNLVLVNAMGQPIPLSQVASIKPDLESPVLGRRDRSTYINVQGDVVEGNQPPNVTAAIVKRLETLKATLPSGYRIEVSGSVEEAGKANLALAAVFPLMFLLMLTTIMLQVRSFPRMLLVFATAPLGLIGAVIALILSGQPFGFNAILGLIGIGGILMRNTLILIDQIEQDIALGLDPIQAVIESTVRRARPVVLTSLAAILAFIPLTFSSFWGQLAIVLIGGVTVGTILILLMLPAAYVLFIKPDKAHAPALAG